MALLLHPVYNTALVANSSGGSKLLADGSGDVSVKRRETRHWQNMTIAIPAIRMGDGLRPVDMGRDLPQIVELLRLVFGDSIDGDERNLFGDSGSGQVNELLYRFHPIAARLSNGFVWQVDGRIVGNATLLTTKAWDRYLVANVAVHPSFRRQGIARNLMQAITSAVKSRGGRVILLQVVKDNFSAINLYHELGYESIGNMATWLASASRVKEIEPIRQDQNDVKITLLANSRWREAYAVDTAHVNADLNWPEPLQGDAYRRTLWQRAADFMNGRQVESWSTADDQGRLTGLASIYGEWGRSHYLTLRVHPDWAGRLERPLLAKVIRRLHYLPRRNVRVDHPEADEITGKLLQESHFTIQRTLTHMRLDVTR